MKQRLVLGTVAVAMIIFMAGMVFGQDFPSKTVRIFASRAGGAGDLTARIIAEELTGSLGQKVIVENRGGGVVAGKLVVQSPPDGHTMLIYANSLWIRELIQAETPYAAMKDFAPITAAVTSPNVIVVHPTFAANSVKELIAMAKAKPGEINYGSASTGTTNHLAAELFKYMAGVDLKRVPYKGMAPALNATIANEVQVMFAVAGTTMAHVKGGRLKALAVTSPKPSPLAPGLPTVATSGVPGYQAAATYGLFAKAGTPAPIVKRLNQEIVKILNREDIKKKLLNSGLEVVGSTPEELTELMEANRKEMAVVIEKAGIKNR